MLGLAASSNHVDVCELLLSRGITISAVSSETGTALHLAVKADAFGVAKLLLERVSNVANIPDINGWLPIHFIGQTDNIEMLKLFVNFGYSIASRIPKSCTLFHIAASYGSFKMCQYLINGGYDVNAATEGGFTPIYIAATQISIPTKLLNSLSSIIGVLSKTNCVACCCPSWELNLLAASNFAEFDATSDILESASSGDIGQDALLIFIENFKNTSEDALKLIISKTADINPSFRIVTPLIKTIRNGRSVGIWGRFLMQIQYTKFTIKVSVTASPVYFAARFGSLQILKLLLDQNAKFNADLFGSPTHVAVELNQVDSGADVNAISNDSRTQIYIAVHRVSLDAVKMLAENGANMDFMAKNGTTVLGIRVKRERLELVKIILEYGADPNGFSQNQPIFHQTTNWVIIQLHLEYGAFADQVNKNGQTKLHMMMTQYASYRLNELKCILDHGANIDAKDNHRNYPLTIAATKKVEIEALQTLIQKGANINVQNRYKRTALQLALLQNNLPKFELLIHHGANLELRDDKK
ncbi:hypothetical protein HK100_007198 [Physocladia obscura]|uniref:Uncharacterized protein n=1 Tax=Physocladia obscura TaxID=109957 RepID=A0AAD5XC85_9FUNG|nr:hypothetical protein HK100_007198 [Physocladia obscura]